jgi:putative adenylate-forming enzyme
MPPRESAILVWHLLRTRWGLRFSSRDSLLRWQAARLARFRRRVLAGVPFHAAQEGQALSALPVMTKERLLENFEASNRAGITLDQATQVAAQAERSRDFSPTIGDVTVGLSSGTRGPRGVFLVSARERAMWAGIMLGRALSAPHFRQLLNPFRPPVRVAFFLRANSNLYETLKSRRIAFRFFDLFAGVDSHLAGLNEFAPDVLVAPARVLVHLAALQAGGTLKIAPAKVISVAEVLEPGDELRIARTFAQPVHQLYQCTEGFLGYTCERGVLHLNEEFVHVETDWLDEAHTRFCPIITDFSRSTQPIVRYRLDDVLRVRATPCDCGRHGLALEAIDGRCDDILWFSDFDNETSKPVFPDTVRHAFIMAPVPGDYRIVQEGAVLSLSCSDPSDAAYSAMQAALEGLAGRLGLHLPTLARVPWQDLPWSQKRRRIVSLKHDLAP